MSPVRLIEVNDELCAVQGRLLSSSMIFFAASDISPGCGGAGGNALGGFVRYW
jgi:hypothetical protein